MDEKDKAVESRWLRVAVCRRSTTPTPCCFGKWATFGPRVVSSRACGELGRSSYLRLTASVGEKFDDMNHVVVEERESGGEPGTILEVLQLGILYTFCVCGLRKSGYKCDGRVVLPVEASCLWVPFNH